MQMLGAFNEYYVANLGREVAKGKRMRAAAGLSNSPKVPYGYRRGEDGVFEPDPEEAPVVQEIFERYATGNYGYVTLVEWLNARGTPARSKTGRYLEELMGLS